ncbi:Hypothetical protein SMAX5B_022532 [Scophthalmus maximus]|uniref:Uncharacterized protein n=1 Tax=Scophthalmus maximus TaxID=52904 RepID=A0A2U9C459_SCOMX|nr:Hypothetical protein SMAX5B_022532 [Scophthalmus maximus]
MQQKVCAEFEPSPLRSLRASERNRIYGSKHNFSCKYLDGYWQRRSPPFMILGNALLRNVSINWNNRIMRRRSGAADGPPC